MHRVARVYNYNLRQWLTKVNDNTNVCSLHAIVLREKITTSQTRVNTRRLIFRIYRKTHKSCSCIRWQFKWFTPKNNKASREATSQMCVSLPTSFWQGRRRYKIIIPTTRSTYIGYSVIYTMVFMDYNLFNTILTILLEKRGWITKLCKK